MKRCVQWNPVYDWKDLIRQGSNLVPLGQQASANNNALIFQALLSCFNHSAQRYTVYVPWMVAWRLPILRPFKSSSVVRLQRDQTAGPLTQKASAKPPSWGFRVSYVTLKGGLSHVCLSRPAPIYLIIIMKKIHHIVSISVKTLFSFTVLGLNPSGRGILHTVNLIPCIFVLY